MPPGYFVFLPLFPALFACVVLGLVSSALSQETDYRKTIWRMTYFVSSGK